MNKKNMKPQKSGGGSPQQLELIKGSPAKPLVTYVLTKDIQLEDAVLDLIDNSIDAARRHKKKSLSGLFVNVEFDAKKFTISDNCGGIPYETARDYAFRFGRPEDYKFIDGPGDLIGNFGVGMKRAILKMGDKIHILSKTESCSFTIDINVTEWMSNPDDWDFRFSSVTHEKNKFDNCGTTIEVTELKRGVSERFGLAETEEIIRDKIKEKQAFAIADGLDISINNQAVDSLEATLGSAKDIRPLYKKWKLDGTDIALLAGIDEPDNDRAGWYVVCNGRTLLRADRSSITGWGTKPGGVKIVNYHHQYARFRGYLIFHSKDPNKLPWNTTKTGVDVEHPLYRGSFPEMVSAMREIFNFLTEVDKEKESAEQPLTEALDKLKPMPLKSFAVSTMFKRPAASAMRNEATQLQWVRYQKTAKEVKAAMSELEVGTASEVGERTFDYWYAVTIKK